VESRNERTLPIFEGRIQVLVADFSYSVLQLMKKRALLFEKQKCPCWSFFILLPVGWFHELNQVIFQLIGVLQDNLQVAKNFLTGLQE